MHVQIKQETHDSKKNNTVKVFKTETALSA